MISLLRNSLKDGGMTTIVWVAVGSMIIGSALPLVMKKSSGDWALKVNGTEISYHTYASELAMIRNYISMVRSQYGQFADYLLQSMGFSDPQQMTMQQLITQQLMVHGIKAQGISVGQDAVSKKLGDKKFVEESCGDLLPAFVYKDGVVDNNLLKSYLQQRGMTIDQLQERIHDRVANSFMQHALETLSYIPAATVEALHATHNATKELAIVRMPLAQYKKTVAADITDEQVRAFYEQENARAQRYYTPEKRSGTIWEFDASGYGTSVDADAVERYYEEHKATRYLTEQAKIEVRAAAFATRSEAEAARDGLTQGNASLATIATEHPFNEEAAQNGGLLKPITRGTGDRVIEKAAFILAADGDLSSVIEHHGKFVLLERVSKSAPVFTPLSKVRDEIKNQLQLAAFKETCLKELHELIRANDTDHITTFIKEHKGTKNALNNISLADAKKEAYKNIFALEAGAYNAVSAGNACYLVHLDTVTEVANQPYESVVDAVKADLVMHKAEQALSQAALEFSHALAAQGLREAARTNGLSVTDYTYKGASDSELRKKYGIESRALAALDKVGTVTVVEHDGDVIIVGLEGLKPSAEVLAETTEKDLVDGMRKRDRQMIVGGYIASLYRDATIEKNDVLALLDKENTI
jgi:peptidyl-prolyl cis-trans isomerase D